MCTVCMCTVCCCIIHTLTRAAVWNTRQQLHTQWYPPPYCTDTMTLLGPNEEQMSSILDDVNETPEILRKNLLELRFYGDKQIVTTFLRGCKHDLGRTRRKLDNYFRAQEKFPRLFSQRDPLSEDIQQAMQTLQVYALPRLTTEGCRVVIHRIATPENAVFDALAIMRLQLMFGDVRISEEGAISGDVFVFDLRHLRGGHCAKLLAAAPLLRDLLMCVQTAYPQRLKQIHLLFPPPFIDTLVNMFKVFMKEKMRNRFHLHSRVQSLHQFITADILPVEYGGNCTDDLPGNWHRKIESYRDWFAAQESAKSKETLRNVDSQNVFGCDGCFTRLTID